MGKKESRVFTSLIVFIVILSISALGISWAIALDYNGRKNSIIEVQEQNKELIRENNELMVKNVYLKDKLNEEINKNENIEFSIKVYQNRMEQLNMEIETLNKITEESK